MAPRLLVGVVSLLFFCSQLCTGCFLNSCPYRRYGRSSNCGLCENSEGLCVKNGVCCTPTECSDSEECGEIDFCLIPQCVIGGLNGYCASSVLCCVRHVCQHNLQCLTGKNRTRFR